MSMSMNEIERALRELRLSGIRATLDTRVLQAQVNQEPFLDTFALILQDELDRRRSRLMERRYQQSGLDERMSLADFDWRFNAKLPRAACFELHTLKFVAEGQNALIIGRPGTGKSHIAKAVAYQATLQGHNVRYWRPTARSRRMGSAAISNSGSNCAPGRRRPAGAGRSVPRAPHQRQGWRTAANAGAPTLQAQAQHRGHLQPGRAGLGQIPRRQHHGDHHP
jgi:hypothetical protein